jgi:hypothetical protein
MNEFDSNDQTKSSLLFANHVCLGNKHKRTLPFKGIIVELFQIKVLVL